MPRRFIVISQDLSGLGWAVMLHRQGEDVILAVEPDPAEEDVDGNARVGTGFDFPRMTIPDALKDSPKKSTYILFDSNHLSPVSEQLRKDGWKVFGASAKMARMEQDRDYAVSIAENSGLGIPETEEFSTIEDAIAFLDEHLDVSYVFKPNASTDHHLTFVPSREDDVAANRELVGYLQHLDQSKINEGFILQARKHGVEVNVEVWLSRGEPFFAMCGLETKRKLNHDLGEHCGCSSDVVFQIPVNSRLVQQTVGKMLPFYQKQAYTGFADVNVILSDQAVWFLEVCNRFGYSAHPNLFMSCALDTFGNLMADWMDGKTAGFPSRFRAGFGASINLYLDHPRHGLPLYISPKAEPFFYAYDAYRENDDLLLAGYSADVGVFAQHGYTIQDAAEACLHDLEIREAVSFPDRAFRSDLDKRDYANAPLKRYEALTAMGALS